MNSPVADHEPHDHPADEHGRRCAIHDAESLTALLTGDVTFEQRGFVFRLQILIALGFGVALACNWRQLLLDHRRRFDPVLI